MAIDIGKVISVEADFYFGDAIVAFGGVDLATKIILSLVVLFSILIVCFTFFGSVYFAVRLFLEYKLKIHGLEYKLARERYYNEIKSTYDKV